MKSVDPSQLLIGCSFLVDFEFEVSQDLFGKENFDESDSSVTVSKIALMNAAQQILAKQDLSDNLYFSELKRSLVDQLVDEFTEDRPVLPDTFKHQIVDHALIYRLDLKSQALLYCALKRC